MSGALTLNFFNQNHLKVTHPGSSSEAMCCVEHPAVTPAVRSRSSTKAFCCSSGFSAVSSVNVPRSQKFDIARY